jgi:hypothetical protein
VPLIIGKFAKPRCFKTVWALPCKYASNKNAWMAFNCNNAMEIDVDMDVIDHGNWMKIAPDMDTNFEEFVWCDDLESTSGPPQDVEEICDAKEVKEGSTRRRISSHTW